MNEYEITLDANYNYDCFTKYADNIMQLLDLISDSYSITRITKIELLQ